MPDAGPKAAKILIFLILDPKACFWHYQRCSEKPFKTGISPTIDGDPKMRAAQPPFMFYR
jgi:hypothetical protein